MEGLMNKYVLLKNGELTTAYYSYETTAKEFIEQYEKEYNNKLKNAEKEIETIYDSYDLNYYNGLHIEIFEHLVDTDFVEYEDIEEYIKAKNKLDELKHEKVTLTIIKHN
jgi:hypothetical protein